MQDFSFSPKTFFAPADRKNDEQIALESENVKKELFNGFSQELREKLKSDSILDISPDPLVILNAQRQTIFANKALLDFLGLDNDKYVLGLRPGEIFQCIHSDNDSGGCGTTEFCRGCGAAKAILKSQEKGSSEKQECEITGKDGKVYNFRVWTFPFGENTIFVIRDIADEVYRNKLERIFFHDLLNISTGIAGLLSLVNGNTENFKKYEKLLTELAEEMLEEIGSQRDLLGAEQGSVHVRWQTVNSLEIIDFVIELLTKKDVAKDKIMEIDENSESVNFKTDKRLIRRIIVNMVKNALEASEEGESVLLKSTSRDNKAVIEVHNNAYIPKDTQLQLFNRSFSTRGCGRGLGAYSMKLLSENYLQGKIYFTSTPEEGTSFFAEYPLEPVIKEKHPDQEQL